MWTEGVPEITKDAEGEWEEPKMKEKEEKEKEEKEEKKEWGGARVGKKLKRSRQDLD